MKKDGVRAVIELRITPQRDCGFGKIAERVSRFEQVEACFLMSGGYDLLVFVKGDSLQDVAQFVAADLSTIDGCIAQSDMRKEFKFVRYCKRLDGALQEE